ncbi:hypothetical protein PC9H_000951 [Pleurotus ostreatus]|uniref:Metaxin glutathione S-transferase domain-containing protein n=2 Tax=Pleurotus ostreatus TaxID=5322 RepID=A0A067P2E4_PLEO1|nr:uncharacterized protein PC9H_000951 [Pleurotus ostreatus]KAF7440605.1 hypothetical protein PC9H_000951 [Pleurotus ostreatus]KAJ8700020.1 hypothetical protein PTI98_003087 [Pleurotus ostreatus]KDQ33395.1 hypothetical protein PLEOSDRAFT_1033864 [Pleurotus ostreatus PC15]
MSLFPVPPPLLKVFALFPLYSYPSIEPPSKKPLTEPTLWIAPPRADSESGVFSSDVDCLKWQAYLALKGLVGIAVEWVVSSEGAIDKKLPNLHVPLDGKIPEPEDGSLLAASMIPSWVADRLTSNDEKQVDALDGYINQAAKDESLAWTTMLETRVRAALLVAKPSPSYLQSLLSLTYSDHDTDPLASITTPPLPPLTGYSSLVHPMGSRVNTVAVESEYREAISALAERLGTDKWFLGSENATVLDALLFAYIHTILHSKDSIRVEVTRRVNLVAWEWRVRGVVRAAFHKAPK